MKQLRLALLAIVSTAGIAYAQDEERRAPPTEIPDFSNLDEYIYEPKSTVTLGIRRLSGAKTSFAGKGSIPSPENPGAATGANLERIYHDGSVRPDTRASARLDSSGNPVVDPQGNGVFDPIAPDGKTNTWNYTDAKQLSTEGYVAFHSYSAEITDTATRNEKSSNTMGLELAVQRDMGKVFNTRMSWVLTGGVSLNDISSDLTGGVQARLRTDTDYYSLYGVRPPDAPYSAPSSVTTNVLDANGNPVYDATGTAQTVTTDTTVLISNEPIRVDPIFVENNTSVTNRWKVRGAFFTFRAGPTVFMPITNRFRASLSIGAALVYSGTTYTVTQSFQPDLGAVISDTSTSEDYKLLPGYYADASLQFDITERAGLYAGAVFQSAGSYTQELNTATANYTTKIDLKNQNGLRAGMTIRF